MVGYKFKELMEKDELYPAGWCHRKLFAPCRNPAKQPRTDEGIVQEVLREKKSAEEAKRQEDEDRLSQEAEKGLSEATDPVVEEMIV